MTLRIFEHADEREHVIALHGWLSATEVAEVEKAAAAHGRALRIELGQLAGADVEGLRFLRRLRSGGARLTGASPYIRLLLERASADDEEH